MERKVKNPKLPLTDQERSMLRKNKIKLQEIADVHPEQLGSLLQVPFTRAAHLVALADFQRIPSIGPQLAQDLVELGYFSLAELKTKEGAALFDELERKNNCLIDPCVEDQLRLVVYAANHQGTDRQWWDFTEERKAYRATYGYPKTRGKDV